MLSGVFAPMVTAFDAEGRLEPESNRRIVEHLVAGGVDGILFSGSTGEFFALTLAEKRELVRFAVEAVAGRTSVLVGTGGTVVEEVVELTRFAREAGADAAVVISPYYFELDQEGLYRYFAQVAGSVDLPIVLYNFPARTAASIGPELVLRMGREFETVRGIKDTVDNISHTRQVIAAVKPKMPDFSVLSGFDEYLVPNLLAGGDGVIGGLANVAPSLHVGIHRAFGRGDLDTVGGLQKRINALMGLYGVSQPFVAAIKGALSLVVEGVSPSCRAPAGALSDGQWEAIRWILAEAGVDH
jgi:4-hydroxy-tetrahydrodipicolinate synthase